jgi:hypothetical protein
MPVVFVALHPAIAQAPRAGLKPTELVVKRHEKLILHGALLTPEGWELASKLFTAADPYPKNGEILVAWTGARAIGEEWNDGSRAQVNTKWNEYYGKIDSSLRFKTDPLGNLPELESFTLAFVPEKPAATNGPDGIAQAYWKIEGPLRVRAASISYAIKYVEEISRTSNDPAIKKNATQTIKSLRRLGSGCAVPNPC